MGDLCVQAVFQHAAGEAACTAGVLLIYEPDHVIAMASCVDALFEAGAAMVYNDHPALSDTACQPGQIGLQEWLAFERGDGKAKARFTEGA
jgi:hypothetical protein